MLDARIVAVHMYQRNALTLRELQSIQSLRDRPVEAAETLLNIIMEQPDAVYLCFLDILKHTEQQHIYQRLVDEGYKGGQLYVHTEREKTFTIFYKQLSVCWNDVFRKIFHYKRFESVKCLQDMFWNYGPLSFI